MSKRHSYPHAAARIGRPTTRPNPTGRLAAATRLLALLSVLLLSSQAARAQLSERFGAYELFYSVVNTTFIEPEVAAEYGIARGKRRAILNLSLREYAEDGSSVARRMDINADNWDLTQSKVDFDFIEVREGPALYYIGEFKFINREWRFFDISFSPENSDETFRVEFKRQMYINE